MEVCSCAPEKSRTSPGAGSGITSTPGVWSIAPGRAWASLPTDFAVLEPPGVVLVVVEVARGVRHRTGEARQVEAHGVGLPHREDRQPPVDLLRRGAVPDVPVPGEGEGDPRREVPDREGSSRLRHVVVRVAGIEPGLGDDRADQLAGALGMDPARLPLPEELGHLGGLDVLVRVLRVVRGEELGQLVPHVVDELRERPQPGQDDQVSASRAAAAGPPPGCLDRSERLASNPSSACCGWSMTR